MGRQCWVLILILATVHSLTAQLRHDANWVFGHNVGLKFENGIITQFAPICNSHELAACISDRDGNLLFYLSCTLNDQVADTAYCNMRDQNHQIIEDGEGLLLGSSCSNGAIVLPLDTIDYKFMIVYQGNVDSSYCEPEVCNLIMYAIIRNDSITGLEIIKKNIVVSNVYSSEKLSAVRHANGLDWWLITQKAEKFDSLTNSTVIILRTNVDSLMLIHQSVFYKKRRRSPIGWSVATSLGNKLAIAYWNNPYPSLVEIYDFNRCDGSIELKDSVINLNSTIGCAFSVGGYYLYINEGGTTDLLRYKVVTSDIQSTREVYQTSTNTVVNRRIALAPNNSIIGTNNYQNYMPGILNADSALGIVEYIDSIIALNDTQYSLLSLPNFPNYNLGPTTIYQADAGIDTFYCQGDTTIKAVTIGQEDTIPGVTYNWLNVDSTQQHRPKALVKPEQSTWYYLELTDTSIQGSCTSRIDSVFVEVRNCTGINELGISNFKLYPNPASTTLTIESVKVNQSSFKLYSLVGELVLDIPLKETISTIDLSTFQSGLYFYSISNSSGKTASGKLMIQ